MHSATHILELRPFGLRLRTAAWALLLVLLVLYSLFQARHLFTGTTLTITSPEDGALSHESLIVVKGSAHGAAFLTLNGRQIFVDEEGRFAEGVLLAPGYNVVTMRIQDRFDREITKSRRIIYTPASNNSNPRTATLLPTNPNP